jgi:hypothetical protein
VAAFNVEDLRHESHQSSLHVRWSKADHDGRGEWLVLPRGNPIAGDAAHAAAARLCHHTVAETCEHIWTGHSLRAGCAPQLDRDGVDLQTIERYLWQLTLGWVSGMRAASVSLGEPHAAVPGADDMPELLAALDLAYAAAVCDVAHLVVTAALADDDLDAVRTAIATALLVAPTTKDPARRHVGRLPRRQPRRSRHLHHPNRRSP